MAIDNSRPGGTAGYITPSGQEVLTNKDHDGGTASNTSRVTLPKASKSALDALTRKEGTIAYGTDTGKAYVDDGSQLKEMGSGGGGINYLSAHFGADALGTVDVSLGDTLASSTRTNPSRWGGSSGSAIISQSTDSTLRGTTNYLVVFTANAQFVESPLFTLDGKDLGQPMSVSFDVTGVSTSDDVQCYAVRYNSSNVLQERIPIAGTASATTPFSARVNTGTNKFNGFFIPSATSTDKYAIRWLRNANNTSMRLDSFSVGPNSYQVGFAGTDWQSFTPTGSWTTNTTYTGKYRRAGDNLEMMVRVALSGAPNATVLDINLPSGLTIDTTKINSTTAGSLNIMPNGRARLWDDGVATYLGELQYRTTTAFRVVYFGTSGSTATLTETNAVSNVSPITWGNLDSIEVIASIPISQWSSNVQMADRAVEEYASNSSSTDADDTTSFVNDVNGSVGIFGVTALTTTRKKRIRFKTNIQPTDTLIMEFRDTTISNSQWVPLGQYTSSNGDVVNPATIQNTSEYGVGIRAVNATDVDIQFYHYAQTAGATYGSAGSAWNSGSGYANTRWRVRKISGGAAVGFPIGASNVIDYTPSTVRADTGNGFGSTNTVIRRFTNFTTTGSAVTPADSATLGSTFTINQTGLYVLSIDDGGTGGGDVGVTLNSAQLTTSITSTTLATRLTSASQSAGQTISCSWSGRLAAGDVVRVHNDGTQNKTDRCLFKITLIQRCI